MGKRKSHECTSNRLYQFPIQLVTYYFVHLNAFLIKIS